MTIAKNDMMACSNDWIEIDFNDKESGQFEMLKQINFYLTEGFYYAQEAS